MSNKTVTKEVKSFENEMSKLRTTATEWHSVEYTNSNNRLYSIFAELYTLYETCIDIKAEANVRKRKWLKEACEAKGMKFGRKPTLQQLLINFAFFVEGVDYTKQQKRLSGYVRVFTSATAQTDIDSSNIAEWIVEEGGIENIRQQTTKSATTKQQRIEKGKQLLSDAELLQSFFTQQTKENATKTDDVVLLVGLQNADGSVSVKHVIYSAEEDSTISGQTVINNALCNVFSKHNEKAKKNAVKETAESEAKASTDISDMVEKEKATISFENELKEVA
ncbi:hypothetical protein OAC03_06975 [Amylibacter sp.]|jgi:hypothetical protein|nr:hypothetical protein [Amylibacter sp.]